MQHQSPVPSGRSLLRTTLVAAPLVAAAVASSAGPWSAEQDADATRQETIVGEGEHRYRWDAAWPALPDGMSLGNTHGQVAVDADGNVYFNTDSEHAVVVIGPDGKYLRSFGKDWKGGLHGMAIVGEGEEEFLYVAHTGRHAVGKLTLEGEELWTVGWPEESGLYEGANQYRPTSIAVRPDGGFYVADGYGRSWVHEYDKDRNWLRAFGGPGT